MRLKIIVPNVIIVLLVGLLSYYIVRQKLTTLDDPAAVKSATERSADGAAGVLQLRLLRAERWLSEQPHDDLRDALNGIPLEPAVRRAKTTEALDVLKRHAADGRIFRYAPDLAALVDKDGVAAGRSDEQQTYHGDAFGAEYKPLVTAINQNRTGSDVWLSTRFSHKFLVSYAPVRDRDGKPIGALVIAWSLSDQNIAELSEGATVLLVIEGGTPKARAKANEDRAPGIASELETTLKDSVTRAMASGQDSVTSSGNVVAIDALRNVGDGVRAAVAVGRSIVPTISADTILWPIVAAAALGIIFVLIAGSLIGSYITNPIGRMEESLLQVINGNTNHRVQIEHAELGGLAYRINQLLNTVLGVDEDDTDDEGRPSAPPEQGHFQEALSVDERTTDASTTAALFAEDEATYYARLYREYIEAKQANGEKTDGITQDVFVNRIRGMEREATAKMGRAVRYTVQRRDKQVVLLAVPVG